MINFLKYKFAKLYKKLAPTVKAITHIKVPIHLPNIKPDKIAIGEPKPKKSTQSAENTKKIKVNKYRF